MPSTDFQCQHCRKTFVANYVLIRHLKRFHAAELSSAVVLDHNVMTTTFKCTQCEKSFKANRTLRRHVRQQHAGETLPSVLQGRKRKTVAQSVDPRTVPFRNRLERTILTFSNIAEFESWKGQEEDAVIARFVKVRGNKKVKDYKVQFYQCHRRGSYASKSLGKRHIKIQGSCKIGSICPSSMRVKVFPTGCVNVSYCPEHRGHDCEVGHVTLRKEHREQLARKLASGIPFDDVLDSCHAATSSSTVSAENLVTRQDLVNICREFGICRGEMLHQNDADSVAAWIELTRRDSTSANLVRYIKFQGDPGEHGLRTDDFLLVICSDAQLVAAQSFCGPSRPICIDSTHGMNSYEFQLTTIMCIDEHGEGLPVAFSYSSRVDALTMAAFFTIFKLSIGGALQNVILMTDDTETYSNAWSEVMGAPAHRLLCAWHVDRSWRRNLCKIKADRSVQRSVYQTIRTLLELVDKDQFQTKLDQFLAAAKDDRKTLDFAKYFENEYAKRPELWAYSHRIGLRTHHNMHLEAMHRVLKHVHLQGRKVRRLDRSIHALLKFLRAKMSDRLLKLHRGKWTRHVGGIRQRHEASVSLRPSSCLCIEANVSYSVKGSMNQNYVVRQMESVPHQDPTCPLMCSKCKVCIHSFACTCLDSGLRDTICKHIHLVVQTFKPIITVQCQQVEGRIGEDGPVQEEMEIEEGNEIPDVGVNIDVVEHRTQKFSTESAAILSHLGGAHSHQGSRYELGQIKMYIDSVLSICDREPSVISLVLDNMKRLDALVTSISNKPKETEMARLPSPSQFEPANKKITPQRSFRSVQKKKSKRSELNLTKPTSQEKEFILDTLEGNVPVLSRQPVLEHDYSTDTRCHTINFEHSYVQ